MCVSRGAKTLVGTKEGARLLPPQVATARVLFFFIVTFSPLVVSCTGKALSERRRSPFFWMTETSEACAQEQCALFEALFFFSRTERGR